MAAEGQIPKKEGLRMWRTDEHTGAFMKGGRGRCCGRVCCCSLILVLVILVSVVTAFLRESSAALLLRGACAPHRYFDELGN